MYTPSFVEIGGGAHFCVLSWHGMSHMALSQGTGSLQLQTRSRGFISYFQLK